MCSNVAFMQGTVSQCSVAGLVLYYVTMCILVFGLACVTYSNVFIWKEPKVGHCGTFGAVLCGSVFIGTLL